MSPKKLKALPPKSRERDKIDSLLDRLFELDKENPFLSDIAEEPEAVVAHLQGGHDQSEHAPDGGSSSDKAPNPRMAGAVRSISENTKQFFEDEEGEVRVLEPGEASTRLEELHEMLDEAGIKTDPFYEGKAGFDLGAQFTEQALKEPADAVFIAGNFAGIAGVAGVNLREESGIKVAYLEILGTTGLAEGAGSALVKEAAKWAVERNLPLMGEPIPAAKEFWNKLGWKYDPTKEGLSASGWTVEETKEIARS